MVAIRLAADGVEKHVTLHSFSAFQFREDAISKRINADARDFFAEAEGGAHLAQVVGERVHDFAINKIENLRALIDQSYFGADRSHERGILEADDSRADDD